MKLTTVLMLTGCAKIFPAKLFENVSGGNVDLKIEGIENFRNQANLATAYFSERKQRIDKWTFDYHVISVEISFEGILAADFPNGMKKGDVLRLKGTSEFTFENDKIVFLKDKS